MFDQAKIEEGIRRVQLEAAQLLDENHRNDKVRND